MYVPPNKQQVIQKCREYYKNIVKEAKPSPFILNVSLTSNPFLKDRQGFRFLKFQLMEYNKRVEKGEVKDPYQMLSFQKVHSMLSDIAQIQTREDQVTALQDISAWYKEQSRLIQQRYDQGQIRYEMSKQYREILKHMPQKEIPVQQKELQIPFYIIQRIIQPYRRHSRTLHSEFDAPARRLLQFKGKTINIPTFADQKEEAKPARVLYPRPPKYEPPKEQQPEQKPPEEQIPVPGQQGVPQEGQPQGQKPEGAQQAAPQQPGMDMGMGLGQQPQQPDEDEPPQDVPDKLKPKNPIYVEPIQADKQKKYKDGYMFYEGNEVKQQRNMQLRYFRLYQDILRKHREDVEQTQIAHDWARRKAKMSKDAQKKLQQMKFKPQFSFSKEPAPLEQKIALQDEIKFGFTTVARQKAKTNQVDLTLPELRNTTSGGFQQKTIRKERLNSLRSKFAKVLNLTQNQSRQSVPSLCQFTARRRGLSQIIRNHSQSKERLNQLEEVGKIKQKLTKVKVNINIKALSRGLCLPQDEHYFSQTTRQFPGKQLPSNPDMVEKKKKKKKK